MHYHTKSYCVILHHTVSYSVILCHNGSCCVLLCHTVSYCVILCYTLSFCLHSDSVQNSLNSAHFHTIFELFDYDNVWFAYNRHAQPAAFGPMRPPGVLCAALQWLCENLCDSSSVMYFAIGTADTIQSYPMSGLPIRLIPLTALSTKCLHSLPTTIKHNSEKHTLAD